MADVKEIALKLISAFFGRGQEIGNDTHLQLLREATIQIRNVVPITDGQRGPSGKPTEFLAPSVWHAVCLLVSSLILTNQNKDEFEVSDHLAQTFFGNRPIYRGQARNWRIIPSLWHPPNEGIKKLGEQPLKVYKKFLEAWLSQTNEYGLELFEKLTVPDNVKAVAQHYQFPTSLVDFTFNPLVALHFAVGDSNGPINDHGVVFFNSFIKLRASSRYAGLEDHISFPPIQVQRIYRQCGFFVDFEPVGSMAKTWKSAEEPWTFIEKNCAKLLFPRDYPNFAEGAELRIPQLEAPEAFFEESLSKLRQYCLENKEFDAKEAYNTTLIGTTARPQWIMDQNDEVLGSLILTDDYISKLLNNFLSYLETSALIHMRSGVHLDPLIVGPLADSNPTPFMALRTYCRKGAFTRSSKEAKLDAMITDSLQIYRGLLKNHPGIRTNK